MAKLTDKLLNRVIEGKFVAQSGDELPKELPAVSAVDNGKALVVSGGQWVAGAVSAGTKLYVHNLALETDYGDGPSFYGIKLISKHSTPYSSIDISTINNDLVSVACNFAETPSETWTGLSGISFLYNGSTLYIVGTFIASVELPIISNSSTAIFNVSDVISDTVTPL